MAALHLFGDQLFVEMHLNSKEKVMVPMGNIVHIRVRTHQNYGHEVHIITPEKRFRCYGKEASEINELLFDGSDDGKVRESD